MTIISSFYSGDLITCTPVTMNISDFETARILLSLSNDHLRNSQEKLHELGVPKERTFEDCLKDYNSKRCRCRVATGWKDTNNPYDLSQCSFKPQSGKNICKRHEDSKVRSVLGYYNKDFWETNPKGEWDNGTKIFTK